MARFLQSNGTLAVYEATPRIMDLGPQLAPHLARLMPWVRFVALMRDPISRAMSKYVMVSSAAPLAGPSKQKAPWKPTDQPTNRPTDRPTNRSARYSPATTHNKNAGGGEVGDRVPDRARDVVVPPGARVASSARTAAAAAEAPRPRPRPPPLDGDGGNSRSKSNDRPPLARPQNDDELFMGNPREAYYSGAWRQWLDVLPAAQLLPVQYEELVAEGTQGRELRRIKEFIGVDVGGLPDALNWDDFNCRHCRIKPEGACLFCVGVGVRVGARARVLDAAAAPPPPLARLPGPP
jgi:hypothetical protein